MRPAPQDWVCGRVRRNDSEVSIKKSRWWRLAIVSSERRRQNEAMNTGAPTGEPDLRALVVDDESSLADVVAGYSYSSSLEWRQPSLSR